LNFFQLQAYTKYIQCFVHTVTVLQGNINIPLFLQLENTWNKFNVSKSFVYIIEIVGNVFRYWIIKRK
jgi:hypothetical protein